MVPTAVKRAEYVYFWIIPGLKKGSEVSAIRPPAVKFDQICEIVLSHYKIDASLVIHSKSRKRERVIARQLIMYFTKKYTTMSLKSIGEKFQSTVPGKGKDHTTVIHSIKTINDLRDTDPAFNMEVNYLESKII